MLFLQSFAEHTLNFLFGQTHISEEVFLCETAVQFFSGFVQPVDEFLRQFVGCSFHVFEVFQKGTVKFVEICFAFYQNGTGKVVKTCEGGVVKAFIQRFNEAHPFIQGNHQPSGTKQVEK